MVQIRFIDTKAVVYRFANWAEYSKAFPMRSDEYVLMRWRDTDGSMRRERVVPVAWKSRTELRTACGTIIDMNKIEEICE